MIASSTISGYESGHPVKASPQAPDVDSSFYGKWHTVKFLWGDDNYELYLDDKLQYVLKGSDYAGMCEGLCKGIRGRKPGQTYYNAIALLRKQCEIAASSAAMTNCRARQ